MHPRRFLLLERWVQLGLLLAAAVLLNLLSARHFLRLDLTEGHQYTLSEASRRLAGRLERPLLVKVYFTRNLDPPYNEHERILLDKLREFQAYSHGFLQVESFDPSRSEKLQAEARSYGIQPIRYAYRSRDRSELKKVYMGAAFLYGDRQESLEAITRVDDIEYQVARVLDRLLSDEPPPKVGLTTGSGEFSLDRPNGPEARLRQRLAERYPLVEVPLGGEEGVPEDVKALLVLGPQRPVSARARYQLDQFLMRGGSLAVFVGNVLPDLRRLRVREVSHGLEGLLGAYGVIVRRDLVYDRQHNGRMALPVRQGRRLVQALVNSPLIPQVTLLERSHPALRGVEQMLFPFASSIELREPLPDGVEATVLARSSPGSYRATGIRVLDPAAFRLPVPGEKQGSWPLMVALTGSFRSAFAGLPIPPPEGAPLAAPPEDPASKVEEGAPARLVVAGSSQVVLNNIPFVLNLVDWMCDDVELVSIRSKSARLPPLHPPEGAALAWVKAAVLLGPVLLLGLAGVLRWALRRRSSYRLEVR